MTLALDGPERNNTHLSYLRKYDTSLMEIIISLLYSLRKQSKNFGSLSKFFSKDKKIQKIPLSFENENDFENQIFLIFD